MDIGADSLNLFLQVGDPENSDLKLNFLYSSNNGKTYTKIDSAILSGNQHSYNKWIRLDRLQKSNAAFLKVDVTDGLTVSSDSTVSFMNNNGIRITSIENPVLNSSSLFCYQKPASDQLTVIFGKNPVQDANITIYNIQGKLVFSAVYQNARQTDIDLKDKSSGMYLVKLTTDKKVYYEKFLKQ